MQYKLAGIFILNWSCYARRHQSFPFTHFILRLQLPAPQYRLAAFVWLKRSLLPAICPLQRRCQLENCNLSLEFQPFYMHQSDKNITMLGFAVRLRLCVHCAMLCYAVMPAVSQCSSCLRRWLSPLQLDTSLHFTHRFAFDAVGVHWRSDAYLPRTTMQALTSASWRNFFNLVSSAPLMDFELVCGSGSSGGAFARYLRIKLSCSYMLLMFYLHSSLASSVLLYFRKELSFKYAGNS